MRQTTLPDFAGKRGGRAADSIRDRGTRVMAAARGMTAVSRSGSGAASGTGFNRSVNAVDDRHEIERSLARPAHVRVAHDLVIDVGAEASGGVERGRDTPARHV